MVDRIHARKDFFLRDIALGLGFDNHRLSGMPQIALTTIEHSSWQKGQNAVEMIYRKNTRREAGVDSGLIIRMEYEPKLIVRRTTGKAFSKVPT